MENNITLIETLAEVRALISDAQKMVEESQIITVPSISQRFALFIERLELLARKIERTIAHEEKMEQGRIA